MSDSLAFERRYKNNGKPNPKYVDLLEVDKSIANQNFGCFSFISPDKILKNKDIFLFNEFVKRWEINKSMEKFTQFLNFISFKYKLQFEELMKDMEEFVEEEKQKINESTLTDDYKTFLDQNEDELNNEFNIQNKFQTSVKGFKCRGVYSTQAEAELRCKLLREVDPAFDIYVGPIGQWLCWDPEAYKTGKVEYMEEELNKLMEEKIKNDSLAKSNFEKRMKETKSKAMEDNIKKAEKSGNVLTQTIDKDGNLVGLNNFVSAESNLGKNTEISVSDIQAELFEGENIVVGKSDNGLSKLTNDIFT
jgi:hypothetical protein